MQDPDFITIKTAPLSAATSPSPSQPTIGVKAGRLPAPEHPTPRVAHPSRKAHCDAEQGGRMTYAATHKGRRLTAAIDSLEPSEAVFRLAAKQISVMPNVRHVRQAQAGTTKKRPSAEAPIVGGTYSQRQLDFVDYIRGTSS